LTWAGVIVEMPLLVQDAIKWEDKCDASLRSLFVSISFCLCLCLSLSLLPSPACACVHAVQSGRRRRRKCRRVGGICPVAHFWGKKRVLFLGTEHVSACAAATLRRRSVKRCLRLCQSFRKTSTRSSCESILSLASMCWDTGTQARIRAQNDLLLLSPWRNPGKSLMHRAPALARCA
jgi:hypothetical protein